MTSNIGNFYNDMFRTLGKLEVSKSPDEKKLKKVTTPATALQHALSGVRAPKFLYDGIPVLKVTTNGAIKQRILSLSSDNLAFFITHQKVKNAGQKMADQIASSLPIPLWTPSRGFAFSNERQLRERYVRFLDIADIDVVSTGVCGSKGFELLDLDHKKRESSVTIYHRGMSESLNLLIDNSDHKEAVVQTIRELKRSYQRVAPFLSSKSLLLRYIWYHVDDDKSGKISHAEFKRICGMINLQIKTERYYEAAPDEQDYQSIISILTKIQSDISRDIDSEVLDAIFDKDSSVTISPSTFLSKFLQNLQGEETSSIDDAKKLLSCMVCLGADSQLPLTLPALSNVQPLPVTRDQFREYLFSEFNSAYNPTDLAIPDSSYWDQPLSKYWINTSHNTYLLGDQLQSKSSVEAYTNALYRGCKCLELDCWDGDNKEKEAVIFHGHTLTSKILFVDVLRVVKAFLLAHEDTLPIILSLENHCSHPFQLTMAAELEEVFGNKLYVPALSHVKGETSSPLPSPNELRGMVVIKGKRPPEPEDSAQAVESSSNTNEAEVDPYDAAMKGIDGSPSKTQDTKKPKIAPELARLTLFHGTKFKSFEISNADGNPKTHMHSIGESKISKILSKGWASEWQEYNRHHMTRTYPSGLRVDSSNYNPTMAWAMGCQLVALNFQTSDTPMLLNDGRFRQAGSTGYILKPQTVLGDKQPCPIGVKVTVLSGSCLPKPKGAKMGEAIDPYVRLELHDVTVSKENPKVVEQRVESCKTSLVSNNGFCPTWEVQTNEFTVMYPDVAILLFDVLDDDLGLDDKIASSAIPVNCLRSGIRSVPLFEGRRTSLRSGPFAFASLLIRIEIFNTEN